MGETRKTMGISRDSFHMRRKTGGKLTPWRKKRKFELGRPPAMTKVGNTRIHTVRVRGGAKKYRALRLDSGNFSWPTESVTKRTRVLNVVYNASNNELVRTNTLGKGCIIEIDSTPFRQWYEQHYGVKIGKKRMMPTPPPTSRSPHTCFASSRPVMMPTLLHVRWMLSSSRVVCWPRLHLGQDNQAAVTATSSRVLSSSSTTPRCPRRRASKQSHHQFR